LAAVAGRTYKTEAIVLRSLRFSEADRILHLYTAGRGRVGAIAKGARKTKSRFGARLEPLSHVEFMLHEGSGELHTVTGVELLRSHRAAREEPYRLGVGLIAAEAMLRLFGEPEANQRAFGALARFLDLLDEAPVVDPARAALDPLVLSFQLKLLWLSGYLPHVTSCVECAAAGGLVGFSARAGGAVCGAHSNGALSLSPEGLAGIERLLSTPLAEAHPAALSQRARREALAVVTSSYEEHGGFRLRTLSA
jgi:DNA repair protein RecO (recombination protein O)